MQKIVMFQYDDLGKHALVIIETSRDRNKAYNKEQGQP